MRVRFQWNSLSTKIIAWSFVPTAIILMAVALVTLNAYQEVTEDLVIERDREVTRLSAHQLISELGEYIEFLSAHARKMDLVYDNAEQLQNILFQDQNRLAAFDGGVVVLDSAGVVKATLPYRAEVMGQNWSDRAYFREMLRGIAKPVYSSIVNDGPRGAEVIVLGVPFIGPQQQFRGMLAGMFRLNGVTGSAFYGSVISLRTRQSGALYLVDAQGRVIYHSDNAQIGADFSAQPVVQQVLQGKVSAVRAKDVQGADIVAAYAPVPGTPWGLISEENWAVLTSDSRGHQKFLLLLLLLGVIVPTLLVFVGVKRIRRPLERLIDAAQNMARGQFGHTIEVRSHDEVGKLAEQFNRMSCQLQASYAHLEQRVADRTRELAALYEVTKVASESLEVQTILERSLHQVLAALNAEVGVIQLLDEQGKTPRIAAQRGIPPQQVKAIDRLPPEASFAHWIIEHKEPLVIVDIATDPRTTPELQPTPAQTYVGVPMRSKQKILGVLSVARQSQQPFSAEDVALLASIADQVGVAIENARLYERVEQAAVTQERSRLARDLHDSVTQSLYSVNLFAEATRRLLSQGDLEHSKEYLQQLQDNAQQALKELRLLVYELRPSTLEHEGLIRALQHRLSTVEERAGVKAVLVVEGTFDLEKAVEEALYRITQEALNNSLKHAAASTVRVQLRSQASGLSLEVCDDGRGFDPAQLHQSGGIGMSSMRERIEKLGGSFQVTSTPGRGTRVKCQLSLNA